MPNPAYIKTAETQWPQGVPDVTKSAVENFFQLLDGYSPQAATQWCQLYETSGEFQAFGKIFKGHENIRQHILRFWASFPGLNHIPKKVYIHGNDMMDLTVITSYEITFSNGQTVSGESVALMEFTKEDGRLLIKMNKLILDPNPLMNGLAAASEAKMQSVSEQNTGKPSTVHVENPYLVN